MPLPRDHQEEAACVKTHGNSNIIRLAQACRRRITTKRSCDSSSPVKVVGNGRSTFSMYLEQLRVWVEHHGSLPKQGSTRAHDERHLARFLNDQQQAFANGALAEAREQQLRSVPGMAGRLRAWGELRKVQPSFEAQVGTLMEWVRQNGRLPKYGVGDAQERRLGAFLNHQRAHLECAEPDEEKLALLLRVSGIQKQFRAWRNPRTSFEVRLTELETWLQESGRLPSYGATDERERQLSTFLRKQQNLISQGSLSQDRKAQLASVKGLRELLDRWELRVGAAKKCVKNNHSRHRHGRRRCGHAGVALLRQHAACSVVAFA